MRKQVNQESEMSLYKWRNIFIIANNEQEAITMQKLIAAKDIHNHETKTAELRQIKPWEMDGNGEK